MNEKFSKPKGFGEILDHTFRVVKNHFSDIFLILLLLLGPIYVLQALIELLAGMSFIGGMGSGDNFLEQLQTTYTQTEPSVNVGADIGYFLLGIPHIVLLAVAQVAILYLVNHIRKGESYTVGSLIKQAFSKFWPITGSTLLMAVITFGLIVVPIIFVTFIGIAGAVVDPFGGFLFAVLILLGVGLGVALLVIRWSFYLGLIAFNEPAPALSPSWSLTHGRTWKLLGLYLIFGIITGIISLAIELPVVALLGNSILYGIIINQISVVTTVIFSTGYAIMFFDLRLRVNADDLKEMIEDYNEPKE